MIPVLVINLERATERRARIAAHLTELGIPFRFIPAVDGAKLNVSAYSSTYRRNLVPGEIATYHSHINAAKMIAESGDEFVCLLEDDAELTPDVLRFLDQDTLCSLPRFDILRLVGQWHGKRKNLAKVGNVTVCAPLYPGGAGHAQIFSRAGAAKIAKYLPCREPIDVAIFFNPPVRRFRVLDVVEMITRQVGESEVDPIGLVRNGTGIDWGSHQARMHRLKQHLNFILAWGLGHFSTLKRI